MAKLPTKIDPALVQRREARRQARQALEHCRGIPLKLKGALDILLGLMNPAAGNLSFASYGTLAGYFNKGRRPTIFLVDVLLACGAIRREYQDREYGRAQILERFGYDIGDGDNIPLNFFTFCPDWPGYKRVPTGKGKKTKVELPSDMVELIALMLRHYRSDAATRKAIGPRLKGLRKRFEAGSLNGRPSDTGGTSSSDTGVTRTGNPSYEGFPLPQENKTSGLSPQGGPRPERETFNREGDLPPSETAAGTWEDLEREVRETESDGHRPNPARPQAKPAGPGTAPPGHGSGFAATGRPGARPSPDAAGKAEKTPSEPVEFLAFLESWNRLAGEGCPSLPVARERSKVRGELLEVWNGNPDFQECWLLFLCELACNPLLSGRQLSERTGKRFDWNIRGLFGREHECGLPYWQAIAARAVKAPDCPEPLERRVNLALLILRNQGRPAEDLLAYLREVDGWIPCSMGRIQPYEFHLAGLVAAGLPAPDQASPPMAEPVRPAIQHPASTPSVFDQGEDFVDDLFSQLEALSGVTDGTAD